MHMATVVQLPKVLMLDVAGNPQGWISYQDSAIYYAKDKVAWHAAEVDFMLRGGINAATGKQSTMTINTIIAIRGEMSLKATERANRIVLTNSTLFQRDRQVCAFCGGRFLLSKLSRDHVIPTSKGGKDIWTNVVSACKPCNHQKGDNLLQDIDMKLLYVPYLPTQAEFLILENRNILSCQMDFLMKRVPDDSQLHTLKAA